MLAVVEAVMDIMDNVSWDISLKKEDNQTSERVTGCFGLGQRNERGDTGRMDNIK